MKGYVYITGVGFDPGYKGNLHDPELFGPVPTLGACMPNIRRFVDVGDYIFVVSGSVAGLKQYLIGGMCVARKVDAREAFDLFPVQRLRKQDDGTIIGNIIVGADGGQHELDAHSPDEFVKRAANYIVGAEMALLETSSEVALGREQTADFLRQLTGQPGDRPIEIIGRMKKLNEEQVQTTLNWLRSIKSIAGQCLANNKEQETTHG